MRLREARRDVRVDVDLSQNRRPAADQHHELGLGVEVAREVVPDGADVGDYLACNLDTKSELVVLIRRGPTILGQIDIDSDVPAGFTEAHHRAVKEVADALAVLL